MPESKWDSDWAKTAIEKINRKIEAAAAFFAMRIIT
jgi:hypothetical protein